MHRSTGGVTSLTAAWCMQSLFTFQVLPWSRQSVWWLCQGQRKAKAVEKPKLRSLVHMLACMHLMRPSK